MGYKVAVVGATGNVGRELLSIMAERNFPADQVVALASSRSVGREVSYGEDATLSCENLETFDFTGTDIVLSSPGAKVSAVFAPKAAAAGAVVIDNTSHFRMEPDVPLVVPEVNPEAIAGYAKRGIIANPNCSTIQMVVALNPLHQAAGLKRVVVSTYQAVSGAGAKGMEELQQQIRAWTKDEPMQVQAFPAQIAFNLFPHIDVFQDNGYTKEEMKMVLETQKIMSLPGLPVSATCVRVPVLRAHSEAIWIETERPLSPEEARSILQQAEGIQVVDEPKAGGYPMPWDVAETLDTYVGRIRKDLSHPNGLTFWVVADQLYKGAALNAIQIGELLLSRRTA